MTWRAKVGPWLSIGVSPGVLLLGAAIAERHGGMIPLVSIFIGVILIFVICYFQGLVGLNPPHGQGKNLTQALPDYAGKIAQQFLSLLLALSMVGWYGFNVGLGGGALAALLNIPDYIAVLIVGIPIVLITIADMKFWNALTILTSLSSFSLIVLVATNIVDGVPPVDFQLGSLLSGNIFLDVAGFLGYIAVFGTRAPDFIAGLEKPRDLVICTLFLCVPVLIIVTVGIALQASTGSSDLIGVLKANNLQTGNLFVVLSIVGAAFTTVYSGSLALQTIQPMKKSLAVLIIAIPGLILAMLRFDQHLISWLTVLAAILPSFALAMIAQTINRRQKNLAQQIPLWVWLPGSLLACLLVYMKIPSAILIGIAITLVIIMLRMWRLRNVSRHSLA